MSVSKFISSTHAGVLAGVLAVLLIVSFVTLAPAVNVDRTSVAGKDLSAYILPDGSLPVICFGDGTPTQDQAKHCDDCINGFGNSSLAPKQANFTIPVKPVKSPPISTPETFSSASTALPRNRAPPKLPDDKHNH